jgi:hypothetical protein
LDLHGLVLHLPLSCKYRYLSRTARCVPGATGPCTGVKTDLEQPLPLFFLV